MSKIDINKLSLQGIKSLVRFYEGRISTCQADLDDYELYVLCQRELVQRKGVKISAQPNFKQLIIG
jgi:hypothetical protein